jgi:hypothetical protein
MTQEYDNTDRGVLFKNDRKEKDTHPDYKGQINVDGEEYWLSAWIKDGKKGKFMSLSIKPKEEQEAAPPPAPRRSAPPPPRRGGGGGGGFDDMDDDIPFAAMASGRGFLSL